MYSDPVLADALAFRGGTALYKLYLTPPARYSEDIGLVHELEEVTGAGQAVELRRLREPPSLRPA